MKHSNHTDIRAHLRASLDGLGVAELAKRLGVPAPSVLKALKFMPDVYIDRWVERYHRPPHAIWCSILPPKNCPKPEPKGKTNE